MANADNNDVAMLDVSRQGRSRSLGFIPVGWYPTSVRFGVTDDRIYVVNGKGVRANNAPETKPVAQAGSTPAKEPSQAFQTKKDVTFPTSARCTRARWP